MLPSYLNCCYRPCSFAKAVITAFTCQVHAVKPLQGNVSDHAAHNSAHARLLLSCNCRKRATTVLSMGVAQSQACYCPSEAHPHHSYHVGRSISASHEHRGVTGPARKATLSHAQEHGARSCHWQKPHLPHAYDCAKSGLHPPTEQATFALHRNNAHSFRQQERH